MSAAGPALSEQVGGVEAVGEPGVAGVQAVRGEHPEVALGRDLAGEVGVGGHDRVAADGGQLGGLLIGQGRAERGHAEVEAGAGERDRDRVHRALDDHRDGALGEQLVDDAEQLGALVEQRGVGGVEVLRAALVGVGEVGAAAADEAEDLALVDHREHHPVAEPVDEATGAGLGGDAGGEHLGVADAAAAQVVDQVGPPGRRLTGAEPLVAGEVDAEPAGEVVAAPRVGEPVLEEGLRQVVDLEHALTRDGGGVPLVGALVHEPDVGVGGLQRRAAEVADVGGQRQVALDVLVLVDVDQVASSASTRCSSARSTVGRVRAGVLGERPVGQSSSGVVDERRRVGLDALPQVRGRLVEVVLVRVLVGSGLQRDRGPPDQRLALVDALPAVARHAPGRRPAGPRPASRAAGRGRRWRPAPATRCWPGCSRRARDRTGPRAAEPSRW